MARRWAKHPLAVPSVGLVWAAGSELAGLTDGESPPR